MPLTNENNRPASLDDLEYLVSKLDREIQEYYNEDYRETLGSILDSKFHKYLTREHLSKVVGIEDFKYELSEDVTNVALYILSQAEKNNSLLEKLDSALLADWARKLIADRDEWQYEVANYIFNTPKLIKIFNPSDLINLLINKGDAGYLEKWPKIEDALLKQGLINQLLKTDNESLEVVLNHASSSITKKIIKEELKRRECLCLERKSKPKECAFNVCSFFQKFEKTQPAANINSYKLSP